MKKLLFILIAVCICSTAPAESLWLYISDFAQGVPNAELVKESIKFSINQGTGSAAPSYIKNEGFVYYKGNIMSIEETEGGVLERIQSFKLNDFTTSDATIADDIINIKPGLSKVNFTAENKGKVYYPSAFNLYYWRKPTEVSLSKSQNITTTECTNGSTVNLYAPGASGIVIRKPDGATETVKCINDQYSSPCNYAIYTINFPQYSTSMQFEMWPVYGATGKELTELSTTMTITRSYWSMGDYDTEIDGLFYKLVSINHNGVTETVASIISSGGRYRDMNSVSIPEYIEYNGSSYPVRIIGANAFSGCEFLTSVELPETLYSIGSYAFRNCTSLVSLKIPDSVIANKGNNNEYYSPISGCSSLTDLKLPDNYSSDCGSYGNSFYSVSNFFEGRTSLRTVTIPDMVESLHYDFFNSAESIETINIGASLKDLPSSLSKLHNLTEINISASNPNFKVENNAIYTVRGENTTTLSKLIKPQADGILRLPEDCRGIESGALEGHDLNEVIYPSNLKSTGFQEQLSGCHVGKLVIPATMESIGYGAFRYSKIDTLIFEHADTPIILEAYDNRYENAGVFHYSSIKKVILNRDINTVGDYNLTWCKVQTKPFYRCSISEIELNVSNGQNAIGAFYNCNPSRIIIGQDVKTVYALGTNMTNVIEFHPMNIVEGALNTSSGQYNNLRDNYNGLNGKTIYAHANNIEGYKKIFPNSTVLPFESDCSIWFSTLNKTVKADTRYQIEYRTFPENMQLNWSSSNPDVVSVDDEGNISALKEGIAYISARGIGDVVSNISTTMMVIVSNDAAEEENEALLTITGIGQHATRHTLQAGKPAVIEIMPDDSWIVSSVVLNGEDASHLLDGNKIVTPALHGENQLDVIMEKDGTTRIDDIAFAKRHIYVLSKGDKVEIVNLDDNEAIAIYDVSGKCVYQGSDHSVELRHNEVYIIKTSRETLKFAF